MRVLTGHKVNGCNDEITITVLDEPGHGGACHNYQMAWPFKHPSTGVLMVAEQLIQFQNGPIREHGTNGTTHEALLAILIDRVEGFQSGPYACEENASALLALQAAQGILKARTEKRLARGVEGTHKV